MLGVEYVMVKYAADYNAILEYWSAINRGTITVCQKIRATIKHLAYKVEHPDKFHFSSARANHVMEFVENFCCHSKGKLAGQLVKLELWERAFLSAIFGFIDDEGYRQYREGLLIVGKKNGKSLLASCIGLYLQVGDDEGGSEVYAVATTREQASIVWNEAVKMVKKSPVLSKIDRCRVNGLFGDFNNSVFKALASDANNLDGLNVHGGIMDEIHQWKNGQALYDIIADGVTARTQPLILLTTTAGYVRGDLYDSKYAYAKNVINGYEDADGYKDERFIAFVYELDKKDEWHNSKCWIKANPGLGTIKNIDTLAHKVELAEQNPSLEKNLCCKEFNISEISVSAWLNYEQANNEATFDIEVDKPKYVIGGFDLSQCGDLTAACIMYKLAGEDVIKCKHMYWMPEDYLEKKVKEDRVPYDKWYERGLLRLCRGNVINVEDVLSWFQEIRDKYNVVVYSIGYDRYCTGYIKQSFINVFGEGAMVDVAQGKKTLSVPMQKLEKLFEKKLINYGNNPITKWCICNTAVDKDRNGNIQPCKATLSSQRIDGLATLLDAYVVYNDKGQAYDALMAG